ncbi:Chaperone protein DnaJ [compost metagenome]
MDFAQEDDHYAVLGVETDADDATIRKAYKKLAVKLHPDRYIDKSDAEREAAQAAFAKVSYAYNVLKDAEQRNEYDFMRQMNEGNGDVAFEGAPRTLTAEELAERRELADKKFRLGMAYQMEKKFRPAMDAFKEAVRIDPDVAQYHTMLAVTYQRLGWLSYAMTEIQAALKLEPKDPLALKIRAQIRAQEKAQAEEEEAKAAKDKKGKKKKKGQDESEPVSAAAKRKAAAKAKVTKQLTFKKKRTSLLQSLLGAIFGRK